MGYMLKWRSTELEKEVMELEKSLLRQAAIVIRDAARSKVAVSDKPHKFRGKEYAPGSLKKSISYKMITEGTHKDELKARVGTGLVYGIFQELGAVKANKTWKFKPFLRPALHEKESEIKGILGVSGNIIGKSNLKPSGILI